jgi:hypothetical protein
MRGAIKGKRKMTTIESDFLQRHALFTYSDDALENAYLKYSVGFTMAGEAYRAWYDPKTETLNFDCDPEDAVEFFELAEEIDRIIDERYSNSDIDILDLRQFACNHLKALIRVHKELQRAPASERRYKVQTSQPIDEN